MFRRALTVLLMFLISLQAYVAVAGVSMHGTDASLQHLADHDQRVAHHHHEDGSIERDNSDASMQHLSQHGCLAFAAIIPSAQLTTVFAIARAVVIPEPPPMAQTVLNDLFRPPRTFG